MKIGPIDLGENIEIWWVAPVFSRPSRALSRKR